MKIFVTLLFDRVAESWGPGRVTMSSGINTALTAGPPFALIDICRAWATTPAVYPSVGLLTTTDAVAGSFLSELFPTEDRYSGTSPVCHLVYHLAGATCDFLPLITTWMIGVRTAKTPTPAIIILVAISPITALGGFIGERLHVKDEAVVEVESTPLACREDGAAPQW